MSKLLLDTRSLSGEVVPGWAKLDLYGHDQLTTEPTQLIVHRAAISHQGQLPAIIDLEHWPLPQKMWRYIEVIDWWREARSDIRVGYYSMIPQREYWAPVHKSLGIHAEQMVWWQQQNAALARMRNSLGRFESRGLADVVDFICPSLYTFYTDEQSGPDYSHEKLWEAYAIANIAESRKYQKQVYPFLWPRYHDSNITAGLQYIGDSFLRRQIDICLEYADGCAIWDYYLDPNAETILPATSAIMKEFT
jgi:hypothetical protein